MKPSTRLLNYALAAALLTGANPAFGKGYSSGGHSYSSHSSSSHSSSSHSSSSHSSSGTSRSSSGSSHSSSGSSRSSSSGSSSRSSSSGGSSRSSSSSSSGSSYKSGSGKSYSSGSSSSSDRKSYTSGKSYGSGSGKTFSSPPTRPSSGSPSTPDKPSGNNNSSFTFDEAAAKARKQETSKSDFTKYKEKTGGVPPAADPSSYRATPPPIPTRVERSYGRTVYIPDDYVIYTRPARIRTYFGPYYSRPVVIYNDPYSSFFWWWLLDRSLDDRAWWAYHHRYDMDPARYDALLANDQQLQARVTQLESEAAQRDPNFVPAGVDRDLMYTDQYISRAYSNRPTRAGVVGFWLVAVPTAVGVSWFFIWLIWFKRWHTATAT